jgi:feruloyl-CoA synthase
VDPADPRQGFEFDGRTTEDFKLTTGTWVSVGPLRAKVNSACSPLVQDVVITGHGRDRLGALVFLNAVVCRDLPSGEIRIYLERIFRQLANAATGSSTRVVRAMIMTVPPSIDAGEITDKGSINQRAVLAKRAELVEQLYAEPPDPSIIVASP